MSSLAHLGWLPAGALVGFGLSFVFADRLALPAGLYHLVYVAGVLGWLGVYVRSTRLDLRAWVLRRWRWGAVAGLLGGAVLLQGVLAHPATTRLSGGPIARAILWRGLGYGAADGLLLLVFPWVVTWRALEADAGGWRRKAAAGAAAWGAVLLVTTVYHLGYEDFRTSKILQPNLGNTIGALPTLLTTSPLASPISHVVLHVAAVLHCPESELYLPPHAAP